MTMWSQMLLLLLWMLVLSLNIEEVRSSSSTTPSPTPVDYRCPGRPCDCIWLSESNDVFLDCSWHYIQPSKDKLYFTTIPARRTVYMTLICDKDGQMSQLWNYMFTNLHELKQLVIKQCDFTDIPPYLFSGLQSLQELQIDGARLTNIHPRFLDPVTSLRALIITNSQLSHMPSLCHLWRLQSLNLSRNAITSMDSTGLLCGDKKLENVEIVDLSYNNIDVLPAVLGYSLPNLKRLSASDNAIRTIEKDCFNRLPFMLWVDLTSNLLTEIEPNALANCTDMMVFGLSNNPLKKVPKGLFSGMVNLIQLDMDYVNITDSFWDEVAQLPALNTLTLAGNKLTRFDPDAISELGVLAFLNISHNHIERITANMFKKQERLFWLDLSYNRLSRLPRHAFRSLYSLKFLDVSHNSLQQISKDVLPNLDNLVELNFSYNRLTRLPSAIFSDLQSLLKLSLSHNNLTHLPNLHSLVWLESLDVSYNQLGYFNTTTFRGLSKLQNIDAKSNMIYSLGQYLFENTPKLEHLDLSQNQLTNLTKEMFRGLTSLYYLNLAHNGLYGTTWAFRELQDLQYLYLQGNQLEEVLRGQFPDSLVTLHLQFNKLRYISHSAFRTMLYLKEVKLTHNKLTSLPSISVELPRGIKPTAKMYIAPNPLQCDCELGWLKDLNEGLRTDYGESLPVFPDYKYTKCSTVYDKQLENILRVPRSTFLCEYKTKCAKNCPCCGFDACHCKYVCPDRCMCVIGDSHYPMHRIHCEGINLTSIPPHLPTSATELLLDHNNIQTVEQHIFLGLSELRILHLNHSNVHHIQQRAFVGLRALQILFLNDNYLKSVDEDTFAGLANLTHLYLDNNRLIFVADGSFSTLTNLVYLNIQYNDFENISLHEMTSVFAQSRVALAFNPWTCERDFVCSFRTLLITNAKSVDDASHVRCMLDGEPLAPGESATVAFLEFSEQRLCDENNTFFINVSVGSVVKVGDANQLALLIAVSLSAAVVVVFVLVLVIKKDLLQVWCYSRFGWRLFSKDPTANDDNRYYDAFVSCSDKDEHFVIHELMPKLENGDKKFKLCLHFRDFPVGAPIAETIVDSVQSSKRTIVVLSDSFLEDEWCHFSFTTAHQQVLAEMKNRLIVILMHGIEERRLDPQIKLYMKTRTYLEYKDPWFWEKLVYALPDVQDREIDMKGAYAVQNVVRRPMDPLPGVYNNGRVSTVSENIINDMYEVPVSSVVYQSVGSAHNTDSSMYNGYHYNSSGHYEEVDPLPMRPRDEQVAPPLPKPRNTDNDLNIYGKV